MKKVFIVEMSDSKSPVFPEVCPICGIPGNEPLVMLPLFGEEARVDYFLYHRVKDTSDTDLDQSLKGVPAHHKCIRKVQYTLFKHFFVLLLIGAAIAYIGVLSRLGLTIGLIAAVIVITPLFFFEFRKPLPVEYHHYEEKYIFCFRDKQYAEKLVSLNDASLQEGDYAEDFTAQLYKKR